MTNTAELSDGSGLMEKLKILADAAKYDVACTSSGSSRKSSAGMLGSAYSCGICHTFAADGRCVSLLKILLTNYCIYDCQYCVNRRSNDVPRTAFTPREVAELTINFYRRNYIEGLFLSSAIVKNPDHTMELLINAITIVREEYKFNGYIHVKAIPGASPELIRRAGLVADRMSVNIEMPSHDSLRLFAPDKAKQDILAPMKQLKIGIAEAKNEVAIYRSAPSFVPAGQSTQMVVGASDDSDKQIVSLAEGLYKNYSLKRVFYSAFTPVANQNRLLPTVKTPLLREHRLYQADWLLRFYRFNAAELFGDTDERLDLNMDPKCQWAVRNMSYFPVEVNTADHTRLLRVPGIGNTSADRIILARKHSALTFESLTKMGIVMKRAKYFITCGGKSWGKGDYEEGWLTARLSEGKIGEGYEQLSVFGAEKQQALIGEVSQNV